MKKIGRREKLIYYKKRSRERKRRKRIKIGIINDLECEELEIERRGERDVGSGCWRERDSRREAKGRNQG